MKTIHPKVKAGVKVSVVGLLSSWLIQKGYDVEVPPEVAVGVNQLLALVAAYFTPSSPAA